MKRLIQSAAVVVAAMSVPATAMAQDTVEATVGADVVSNYIWRGQDMGAVAVQPSLGLSYKGFSLSAWGSYGIVDRDDTKELDFTLSYTTGGLTVGITDYYVVSGVANCPASYFLYDSHKTAHVFEANVGYDFGKFSINWFTNFAGADGMNKDGKRAYSSYVEVAAPFTLGGLDCEATVGAVPYATSIYADANGLAVTNVQVKATKEVEFTPSFKLPIFGAVTANPSTQSLYFTAGVSF